ncbi:hypothetical protein [Aureimonas populi]|uniref:LPS export ABC transporter periplasmic protein LptC n=1 Tax=Aureimonas populi TaxID=1701758 RepID=A0ABW5CNL6_9HYPH|nr:hypothetical protein [Aureimonas populi]
MTDTLPHPAGQPADAREREFARARRHSRKVRLLKLGLPILACAMVLAGIGAAFVARNLPGDFTFAATALEDGRLVMEDPRMSGSDANDRPYSVIARRAIQSLTGTGVDLEGIDARLTLDERTDATLKAAVGFFDPEAERLLLSQEIAVDTTSGISIRLPQAAIDLAGGRLEGSGPVSITMPNQSLQSGSVVIEDGGSRLIFGDRVKLTLLPNGGEGEGRANSTSD